MRILRCRTCATNVNVHEAPCEFIDPALFVCGACLEPVTAPRLEFETPFETRDYDPTVAEIPF